MTIEHSKILVIGGASLIGSTSNDKDEFIRMASIRIAGCASDPREAMEVMNEGTVTSTLKRAQAA